MPLMALGAVRTLHELSAACPVCFDANEENRVAFLATTALLTLLPLGLASGVGVWLRRRWRAQDAGEPPTRRE